MRAMRLIYSLALPIGIVLFSLNTASAQGSDDARQACTPDAMRLCSEFIPDAEKVKLCMLRKRGQLSPECRSAMRGGGGGRHRVGRRHRRGRVHCRHHCG